LNKSANSKFVNRQPRQLAYTPYFEFVSVLSLCTLL